MDQATIFNQILIWPFINVLVAFYKFFEFIRVPGALGLAVIALTVLIRLILHPLTAAQLKSAQKLAKLKPEMDKLTALYKNDKARLSQEQLHLYKEAGVNPAAGCLPLLLQFPILIGLYQVFFQVLSNGNLPKVVDEINKIVYTPILRINSFDLSFFGLNLAYKPNEWQKFGWWLLLVPVITGLLQYWQTKMMTPKDSSIVVKPPSSSPKNEPSGRALKNKEEEKKPNEDMSTAMQKQMTIMMPLMIGFFAYSFPLGLSLYWNTFTIFGIIQQYKINKEV